MEDSPKISTDVLKKQCLIRIIDDEPAVRHSLAFLLEGEGWHVATYSSAEQFRELDSMNYCGCLILDVRMPDESGLELQQNLIINKIDLPILFMSAHGDIDMAVHALKQGAYDFIPKPADAQRLLTAVEQACLSHYEKTQEKLQVTAMRELYDKLTDREKEILQLVVNGALNKQIAIDLNISEKTVQAHRSSALHKLKVKNSAEALHILMALH